MPTHPIVASPAVPRLEIRLLGRVDVILDGRRLRAFDSLRLQRALGMIAIRRDLQHRSRLAFELWPDSTDPQARTNLRKLIHELRRAITDIDAFIEIDHEVVRWIPTGPSSVDVLGFREAVSVGDLERAAHLYAGDLLPACYDEWVLAERRKLKGEAREVLVTLARRAAELKNHRATIDHALRLVDLDPTAEGPVRLLMEAHAALGDKTAALRAFHRYAEVLDREIGLAPPERIAAVYERLRNDRPGRDAPAPDAPGDAPGKGPAPARDGRHRAGPVTEAPFVGRHEELAALREAWKGVRDSGARLILVTGEPGIGKSRLAEELARRVRSEDDLVASARAYEAAGRLPWGPVVDLLRSPALRPGVEALAPAWRAVLSRLLPELGDETQSTGRVSAADPAQRHRLFDSARRALVAGERPRLLIVDDLQWCDAETIELIGFVVRSGREAPALVVGTVRLEEVAEDHPLTGLMEALTRAGTLSTVALERFDQETTAALAGRLGGMDSDDPDVSKRLWEETEGNPLFVVETLRAGFPSRETVLTPTMRAVLGARLGQLTADARRVAEIAAVIGRPFTVELMAAASGMDESATVDLVDELWSRRIVRDQGATYDFTHDKLRAVALEMISPARRRRWHRAVAEAIRRLPGGELEPAGAQLAAHYDQAGMVEPAIEAYRAGGAHAVSVSSLGEAVGLFRRALTLIADLPPSPRRDALELDLRIALGSPLVAVEGYGSRSSHELYERALSLSRRLGRPVDPPIHRGLGLARLQGCRFEDCTHSGRALLESEGEDRVTRTEGHYLLGVSAFWRGDLAPAREHLEAALRTYDASRRDEHLALYAQDPHPVCLVRLAWCHLWAGDPGRADEMAREAVAAARDLEHLMTSGYVTTYAAIIAAESGDLERLEAILADAERLWKRLTERYLRVVLDALAGWLDVRRGRLSGIERIVQSVVASRAEGETLHLTYCLLLLARARDLSGEIERGLGAAREGIGWSEARGQGYLEAELMRTEGVLSYRAGRGESAVASLRRAAQVASGQGARWLELEALGSLAARFDDDDGRQRLAELVSTLPSGHELPAFRAAEDLLSEAG